MGIGATILDWLGYAGDFYGERLGKWSFNFIAKGLTKFAEDNEPGIIDQVKGTIQQLIDNPDIPEVTRDMLKKSIQEGNIFNVVMGWLFSIIGLFPAIFGLGAPLGNILRYIQEGVIHSQRLDPETVIKLWRRFGDKWTGAWLDLTDLGWSDDRIEALKDASLFYPAPADLIRWQAREVFEPEMIRDYGLDDEYEAIEKEPFYRAGMTDEQILNFWRAHWEHASWMQVVEMLHRGLLTEAEVWDWFRLVEIPPFWRQRLIDTAYTWPTRVDVRRWWDMRTISEDRLRELYSGMGYRGENLEDYIRWTKVYTDFPMMMARWKNGWITIADVRSWLRGLEIPEERITHFIQEKVEAEKAERTAGDRELTKTEIYKGVKKDVITWDQGIELLIDLGYDEDEADYILTINVEVLEGSPESYADFKNITQKYRRAAGLEAKTMPDELKAAAAEVVRMTDEVKSLQQAVEAEQAKLVDDENLPEAATERLKEIQVALHRAESELQRVTSEYKAQVAEWRQRTE